MLSYEWLVSIAAVISLLAVLASCICGCRKTVPKNELLGLPGMVKITNPEENCNHNHPQGNQSGDSTVISSGRPFVNTNDANRRTTKTANRSLPDIPIDSERVRLDSGDTLWEGNEPNGDTCSELYATVEENKNSTQPSVSNQSTSRGGKQSSSIAASDDGKSSEYSSLSHTDDSFSPYAQVKSEHPYDRLKNSEHPYAKVGTSVERSVKHDLAARSRLSGPAGMSAMNPIPPPRVRKANSFDSDLSVSATDVPSSVIDIPAATAIAGRISANPELPYMTPPIVAEPQTHFSGDSQDSSKGYTSISVREPLANIKAQTRLRSRTQELTDSLYATVSDDSEEMYAAIEDSQPLYTSGSETYAQIQPLAVIEPVLVPNEPIVLEGPHIPPQPPSVDSLKHVAQVHSRQASSSSAASSVANLGSPKPEKRQANSPLPPPPAGSPELYATVDKKGSRDQPTAERTLEEMYAKVIKKNQRSIAGSRQELSTDNVDEGLEAKIELNSVKQRLSSVDVGPQVTTPELTAVNQSSDNVSGASVDISSSRESIELRLHKEKTDIDADSLCSSNAEFQSDFSSKTDKSDSTNLHPYQLLPAASLLQLGYESVANNDTVLNIDPGYEVVKQKTNKPPSDCDPNYEELRPQVTEQDYPSYFSVTSERRTSEPGYASIARTSVDPGYEQVRSRSLEPGYASINKTRKSRNSDTNEPNYESMRHMSDDAVGVSDPNYEIVKHDPNYESVYSNLTTYPPYERLNESDNDVVPGYEEVIVGQSTDEKPIETKETVYEEVDVGRKSSNNGGVWETGRHKLI